MITKVIELLAFLTLLSNIFLVFVVILFVLSKYIPSINSYWNNLQKFLKEKAVYFSFILALTATAGSLFLSEIALFTPCKFCWLQRIFMYPMVVLFAVSIWSKAKDVFMYAVPLTVIGGLLAAYHYYIQLNPNPGVPCTTVGFSVSCSDRFFTHYGYITIPLMALSAFVLIGFFGVLHRRSK